MRVLTGITTTGTPHLGNYVGAIRPAIAASREPGVESFLFLADLHALIKCDDPERIARSRRMLAATWLAAGLDPERVVFYRQSDIPEIPELTWLLTCATPKGLMNRAHAYKAAADASVAAGGEPDEAVTMGLFSYPVLMAADILLFNADQVPVGRDQVQHVEMARDIAQRFSRLFGNGQDLFVLPQAAIDESLAMLPGLDGRKMSKSYDNTIALFEGGAQALRRAVARIVTDSRAPGEPKEVEGSALVTLYDAFADAPARQAFRAELRAGLGWGEAKQRLADAIDAEIGPMRARYEALMAHPERIEQALQDGARKARAVAAPFLATLRAAAGLRAPATAAHVGRSRREGSVPALPRFKQYREADGRFHFKLVDAQGRELLQSHGFEQGREAGHWVARLKAEGADALAKAPVTLSVPFDDVARALARLLPSGD